MITSAFIGITAWVFSMILLDPDMIFGWYGKFLDKLPAWLSKPLGKCEYCLSGQLSLWYYLFNDYSQYNLITHIFFVSLSIFTVEVINVFVYGKK